MFAKLMKYEFRATRKAMGVLCLTALLAGVLGGCSMGFLFQTETAVSDASSAFLILCGMVLGFSVLFIALCGAGAMVLNIARFYRSRFADEGYLIFTLPVTGHQVLLASLLSSMINLVIAAVVVILSFGILGAVGCSFMADFWEITWEMLPKLIAQWADSMTWKIAGAMGVMLLNMLTGSVYQLVIIMLSVTIGALTAKKHKILAAVGVFYGISVFTSVLSAVMMTNRVAAQTMGDMGTGFLNQSALMFAILSVAAYFLTHYLITKKLNLP